MAQVHQVPQMAVEACSRLVEGVAAQCARTPIPAAPLPEPEQVKFDGLATAIAWQANAFTWGGLLLAATALIGGFFWARWVRDESKEIGRESAKSAASDWMDSHAHELIAEEVAKIVAAREKNGTRDDAEAVADALGDEGPRP